MPQRPPVPLATIDQAAAVTAAPPAGALSDTDILRLEGMLGQIRRPDTLSLEALDGLFCALIAGPGRVGPDAYLPVVLGGDPKLSDTMKYVPDAGALMSLILRYRDMVAAEFRRKTLYLPRIDAAGSGDVPGRAWARAFMRGVGLAPTGWSDLFGDEREGDLMVIPLVAGEVDPGWPREPLRPQARDEIIRSMAVAIARSYRYFNIDRGR